MKLFICCCFFLLEAETVQPWQGEIADTLGNVLEELDFLIFCDNSMMKHDRLFRMNVRHVAISSEILILTP